MAIIQCPQCKAILKHDATACNKCGYDLTQPSPAAKTAITPAESEGATPIENEVVDPAENTSVPAPKSGKSGSMVTIIALLGVIAALIIAVVMLITSNTKSSDNSGDIAVSESVEKFVPSTSGLYPHTSVRVIAESELYGMTPRELKIMRNEIFARNGKIFKTKDMAEYFSLQNWYRAHAENVTLSEVEQFNVAVIKAYEDKLGAQNLTQKPKKSAVESGLFPFTSTRKITYDDICELSEYELKIMRNEIYARHGYIFDSEDMKRFFSQQSWYRPVSKNITLSSTERYNVEFIKSYEQ